jgi:type IV pilus assembly protein PilO
MKLDELKDLDLQELIENLQELDFQNVGSWPLAVRAAAAVLVFVAVVAASYFLSIKPYNTELAALQKTEQELMEEFESKAFKAQNLDQYRKQLDEMEKSFGSLLKQLPKDTEVPGLLEDITHTGLGSGLEFEQIALGSESEKEFYAELPINVEVNGDYHGFGSFVSGVASLPRIVTLHDFKISSASDKEDNARSGLLKMTITAKTYRYASREGDGGAGKGGKG